MIGSDDSSVRITLSQWHSRRHAIAAARKRANSDRLTTTTTSVTSRHCSTHTFGKLWQTSDWVPWRIEGTTSLRRRGSALQMASFKFEPCWMHNRTWVYSNATHHSRLMRENERKLWRLLFQRRSERDLPEFVVLLHISFFKVAVFTANNVLPCYRVKEVDDDFENCWSCAEHMRYSKQCANGALAPIGTAYTCFAFLAMPPPTRRIDPRRFLFTYHTVLATRWTTTQVVRSEPVGIIHLFNSNGKKGRC